MNLFVLIFTRQDEEAILPQPSSTERLGAWMFVEKILNKVLAARTCFLGEVLTRPMGGAGSDDKGRDK